MATAETGGVGGCKFKTEQQKREHVIKLNLVRRHLEPHQWGAAFKMLLKERGIERKAGAPCKGDNSETVSELSRQLGVDERTARNRMKASERFSFSGTPAGPEGQTGRQVAWGGA